MCVYIVIYVVIYIYIYIYIYICMYIHKYYYQIYLRNHNIEVCLKWKSAIKSKGWFLVC